MAQESNGSRQSGALNMTDVRALARILKQYDLSSLEVELEGAMVRLKRDLPASSGQVLMAPTLMSPGEPTSAPTTAAGAQEEDADIDDGSVEVTSPFVGTFYRAPSPDTEPYVEEGQHVSKGQVLCIVEAMKLMNEIECETPGKLVRLLIQNGEPVEFGQPLFRILPAA